MSAAPRDRPGTEPVLVGDDPARRRYEARIDGQLAAIAEYLTTQEFLVFSHTEVLPGFEGRGIATALVRQALDDVRTRGLRVAPLCPFVADFIRRNAQEYGDLVFASRPPSSLRAGD
ncbi:N-acetyltransferase [Paenibacillus sp. TRM 82003]|uniref:GNAT family N-acetyltransferase n=1 Tax=Kineococcus sp. TRM81007 TaxID=2925831 RepID=UPI001F56DB4D|nr:GNAT family N-acetyltransferase [Kineococcus sp. TRM81007]MCI2237926.1 N-acetyltransferase [Kineococcus sp. TRM81007]MCI3925939.1 N-acetyltransferase [Paenibacillus sp. TRM 82003]